MGEGEAGCGPIGSSRVRAALNRGVTLSLVAAMLSGTALAPATAQVFDIGGGTLSVTNFAGPPLNSPTVVTNGTLRANIAAADSFGGVFNDSLGVLALRKEGVGVLTLSGLNTHSGTTTVSNGRLVVGANGGLSVNSLLSVSGPVGTPAIVDLNGFEGGAAGLNGSTRAIVTSTTGPGTLLIVSGLNHTYSGALQGQLNIVKSGAGTQTFTNADPALAATTMTGTVRLLNGGIAVGSTNALGSGNIIVDGNGTLSVAGIATVGLDNDVVLNANLATLAGNGRVLTLNGDISGTGGLTKTGIGTLRLNGTNSYGGDTLITSAGRLEVGSNNALGTGVLSTTAAPVIALADPAVGVTLGNNLDLSVRDLTFETGDTGTIFGLTGDISGGRNILLASTSNGGTLLLSGDNSAHTGALVASAAGVIGVGSSTAVGSSARVLFADGGTLAIGAAGVDIAGGVSVQAGAGAAAGRIDTGGFNGSISGLISDGAGADRLALVKTGAGTLTLAGVNSYTGGTTIEGGSLAVSVDGALGSSRVVIADGGTLAAAADGLVITNDIQIDGRGTVDTGANTLTISGTIGDVPLLTFAGQWQVDEGPSWFSAPPNGPLAYTGQEAAALLFGGTAADYQISTAGIDPALVNNLAWYSIIGVGGGAELAQDYSSKYLGSFYGPTSGFIFGDPNNAASAYIDDNAGGAAFTNYAFTSTSAAPGTLVKAGSGTLILTGDNTYTGGTDITAGTIAISSDTALGTGDISFSGLGGTLQALASFTSAKGITLDAPGRIDTNGNDVQWDGIISGPASLTKLGAGILTLTGTNTHVAGTLINGGTVVISSDANLGAASGPLGLDGGTLATTADVSMARAVTLGAGGGTLDVAAGTTLLNSGVIGGTGSLTKIGGGTLALTGANTYTGGTTISAGGVRIGTGTAFGTGTVALAGGTTLTAGNTGLTVANTVLLGAPQVTIDTLANTLTLSGSVGGAGGIIKAGTGTLVLSGANSHAGGTNLTAGQITAGSNTALGAGALTMADGTTLANGGAAVSLANAIALAGAGTVTINSGAAPASFTLSGPVSGAAAVNKTGTGILSLTGASTYTGATTVTAGTLNVTGSLVSPVQVASGAAITGTGSVGALVVSAGATISPGMVGTANAGTLTVNGPASLLGTYNVNIVGAAADRVTATGDLTLGGTLAITSVTNAAFNATYTIASGATRTGTFGTVTGLGLFGPAYITTVEYTATAALIRTAPNSLVTILNLNGGGTGNALATAQAFDRAVANGFNPTPFVALYGAGSALPRTLLEMSGEQRATERRVMLETHRVFRETALDRLNIGLASLAGQQVMAGDEDSGAVTFWLRGAGSWGTADTSGAATGFTTEQRGILTGMDWSRDGLTVGAMFHYTSTDIDYRVLGGSSNVETVGGTFYGGYRAIDKGLVANAGISVADARSSGGRAITLPALAQTLAGRTRGTTFQVFGELAWDLAGNANTRVEPFARLTYVQADMKQLQETGGIAALTAAKQTHDIAVTNLGLRVGTGFADGKVALNASAAWQRTSGSRDAVTTIGIPALGQNALIRSVELDPDAALLQADIGFNLSDRARINVGYSGLLGKNNSDHAGRATLSFAF